VGHFKFKINSSCLTYGAVVFSIQVFVNVLFDSFVPFGVVSLQPNVTVIDEAGDGAPVVGVGNHETNGVSVKPTVIVGGFDNV
jgi:hypothetical protein